MNLSSDIQWYPVDGMGYLFFRQTHSRKVCRYVLTAILRRSNCSNLCCDVFSGIVWPQGADFAVTWALKSFDIGERLILWCIISKRFEMVRYHCLFLVFDVPNAVWSHQRSHQSKLSLGRNCQIPRAELHWCAFQEGFEWPLPCWVVCKLLFAPCWFPILLEIEHPIKITGINMYQPIHSTDLVGWRSLFWGEPGVESSNGVRGPRRTVLRLSLGQLQ